MHFSKLLAACGLAATAIFATSSISQAASLLIDKGGYTADPVAHLDWLDLNATTTVSYNQLMANDGVSYIADGWRLATFTEVQGLYEHAGIVFDSFETSPMHQISYSAPLSNSIDPTIWALTQLLGVTFHPGSDGNGISSQGYFEGEDGVHFGLALAASYREPLAFDGRANEASLVTPNVLMSDIIGLSGHPYYLVRDDNIAVTPLPAALPMFAAATGLLGFAGWRRRNANRA